MPDSEYKDIQLEKKIEDFGGLIDSRTAKLLIDYENGQLTEERLDKLKSKLEKMVNSAEDGLLLEVENERNYTKRDGSKGTMRGMKIVLSGGREARALFWDRQIQDLDADGVMPGTKVILTNCIYSENKYGLTINTGKGGSIRLADGTVLFPKRKK